MTGDDLADLRAPLASEGFALVRAPRMREVLAAEGADREGWDAFAASWDDLGVDTFMADGGRYRKRRFACFEASARAPISLRRKPHQIGRASCRERV